VADYISMYSGTLINDLLATVERVWNLARLSEQSRADAGGGDGGEKPVSESGLETEQLA